MARKIRHVALPAIVLIGILVILVPLIGTAAEPATPAEEAQPAAAAAPAITVSPSFPSDIPGGAANATLATAAAFAWQEFIAANWPAQSGKRDTPNTSAKFGQPGYSGPVVWETYRGKVETFPGNGKQPPGYVNNASQSYGYDAPPPAGGYPYETAYPACSGKPSTTTPWVNLDEVTQIGLNQMYAGAGPGITTTFPGPEILFLAKSNREHYVYSVQPRPAGQNPQKPYSGASSQVDTSVYGLWNHSFEGTEQWQTDNAAYNALVYNFVNAYRNGQKPVSPYMAFPAGTVEAKAGWRQLTGTESSSGRFHTQLVRYYTTGALYKKYIDSQATVPDGDTCYVDDTLGLTGLHIIHKTPSAPYFVYATFGQTDNIQTTSGQAVENPDGKIVTPVNQPALCPGNCPSSSAAYGIGTGADPAQGIQVTLATSGASGQIQAFKSSKYPPNPAYPSGPFATCNPGKQLYYSNTPAPLPQGTVCVTQRVHPIPQPVIDANTAAHQAIAAYNQANGITSSPWLYYKLVNVQWKPVDKPAGTIYHNNDPSVPTATYYQANIVIETDYNLQVFSGQFQGAVSSGADVTNLITDYWGQGTPMAGKPFHNVYTSGLRYNMGGCMGCHGNTQVANGTDFSFIMQGGPVTEAEAAGEAAETMVASDTTTLAVQAVPGTDKYYKMRQQKPPAGSSGN